MLVYALASEQKLECFQGFRFVAFPSTQNRTIYCSGGWHGSAEELARGSFGPKMDVSLRK